MVLGTTPAALVAAALCNSYRTRQIERRHPPARRFVEVDGRAEAEDGAGMTREAAAMQDHYGELRLPMVIMAGSEDQVADVGRQSIRLHEQIQQAGSSQFREQGIWFIMQSPSRLWRRSRQSQMDTAGTAVVQD